MLKESWLLFQQRLYMDWGGGGDATNVEAVRGGIFAAKERPFFDPLIVHIAELSQLDGLVAEVSNQAKALMEQFWPGPPLTLVMKKTSTGS